MVYNEQNRYGLGTWGAYILTSLGIVHGGHP